MSDLTGKTLQSASPSDRSRAVKKGVIIAHDLIATALALLGSLFLRENVSALHERFYDIVRIVPLVVIISGFVYKFFHLYESKWRFASLPDLFNIFKASSLLAFVLLVADYFQVARGLSHYLLFAEKTVTIYWLLQMFLLGGPRLAYRYLKYVQSRRTGERDSAQSVLVAGRANEAEVALRALETGLRRRFIARAILSPARTDHGTSIRNVPVLGGYGELERVLSEANDKDQPITRIILAPQQFGPDADSELLVATAGRLGIALSRLNTVEEGTATAAALKPLAIEDLLFRESVAVDRPSLAAFLAGKRVIVTGGGGSIGSELCSRLVAFGATDLLILDSSEPALYGVREQLAGMGAVTRIESSIADVRDRARIFAIFRAFRPDLVFHAAALKQVPYLEIDWAEGVKTNVFGSVNVADASAAVGGSAIMISTDKAVDPVSILGATKRLSEIYAQLVDAESTAAGRPQRLASVRFGNVLGSVGSVVPRFKAQIERGGPVTVTHPEMVRYFMTVREACDLVLTAARHAASVRDGVVGRASVYVLKMGQPARIVDLAERMIRLAGYEPGREIDIEFSGVRKGERLNEYLFTAEEPVVDIGVAGVTAALTTTMDRTRVARWLEGLAAAVASEDRGGADRIFREAIPSFRKLSVEEAPSNVINLPPNRLQG